MRSRLAQEQRWSGFGEGTPEDKPAVREQKALRLKGGLAGLRNSADEGLRPPQGKLKSALHKLLLLDLGETARISQRAALPQCRTRIVCGVAMRQCGDRTPRSRLRHRLAHNGVNRRGSRMRRGVVHDAMVTVAITVTVAIMTATIIAVAAAMLLGLARRQVTIAPAFLLAVVIAVVVTIAESHAMVSVSVVVPVAIALSVAIMIAVMITVAIAIMMVVAIVTAVAMVKSERRGGQQRGGNRQGEKQLQSTVTHNLSPP